MSTVLIVSSTGNVRVAAKIEVAYVDVFMVSCSFNGRKRRHVAQQVSHLASQGSDFQNIHYGFGFRLNNPVEAPIKCEVLWLHDVALKLVYLGPHGQT